MFACNFNHGTRTASNPLGNGSLGREVEAIKVYNKMQKLVLRLSTFDHLWSLENPRPSYLWKIPGIGKVRNQGSVITFMIDMCMYSFKFPDSKDDEFCRKTSQLRTNLTSLSALGLKCTGEHQHAHAWSGVVVDGRWCKRTALAAAYPEALCRAWAEIVQQRARQWCGWTYNVRDCLRDTSAACRLAGL